jgi:hypothetical protein
MATKKPAPKPARKPEPRPAPKLAFRTAPKPAPLDLVRNTNFDSAMAQQNYANSMAQQRARMEAELGQFTEGRLMGAPERQSQQAFQDEIARRNTLLGYNNQTYGSYVNQPAQQGFGDVAGTMSSAGQLPSQQQFNPNAPSLMPIYNPGSNPQDQQMQNYQNFLQQGMQNSNTLNQGAMNNFANMQPRMQPTQISSSTTPNQTMQVAGMGMQKSSPAPRKFSIANNPSAKAF